MWQIQAQAVCDKRKGNIIRNTVKHAQEKPNSRLTKTFFAQTAHIGFPFDAQIAFRLIGRPAPNMINVAGATGLAHSFFHHELVPRTCLLFGEARGTKIVVPTQNLLATEAMKVEILQLHAACSADVLVPIRINPIPLGILCLVAIFNHFESTFDGKTPS